VRSRERWKPTAVVKDPRSGRFSPDFAQVFVGSRFIRATTIDEYVRLIRRYARGRLLDCGCGEVPYYEVYKEVVDDNVCVDWQPNDYLDEVVDLNGPMPFGDEAFDTLLASDLLEHLAKPELFMREAARVLRPGGMVLIMVPFLYWIHEPPHDYYRYTEFALRALCGDNGLEVVHLEPYGGYPDILLDLFNKIFIRRESTARPFMWLCRRLVATGPYGRWRSSTKEQFPQGYCLVATKVPSTL
jgi:SAM-dependent methyltransferase